MQNPPSSNLTADRSDRSLGSRSAILLLLLGTLLLYGVRLGNLDFWAPDEPRYGAIAEELRSFRHGPGGLVLLHTNDRPYTQKPPLYFWLAALAGLPGGLVTEWAARLPSALAGVGCVAMLLVVGRRLLARPALAWLAAGLLATSFRFVFTARRAQLDVLLTSFELFAIALFLWHEFRPGRSRGEPLRIPIGAVAGLHAALGAAALVKGPVGWLPLAVIAAYLGWEGRIREFRALSRAWVWLLSIGPICLWIAGAVALAPAGFAEIAVTDNLLGRFFSGTSHARPVYYYLYQTPADFLPWTLLLPFGLPSLWRAARVNRDATDAASWDTARPARFLLSWILVPLLFFSLSAGKRGVYLLPIFPALACVAAVGAGRLRAQPATGSAAPRWAGWAIAGVAAVELVLLAGAAPRLEAEKSPRPVAEGVARIARPDEAVGVYGLEPIEGAISYYGGRKVVSLDDEPMLSRFFLDGGRLVLMRRRHFDRMAESHGLDALDRFRSGRRELVLAASRPPSP